MRTPECRADVDILPATHESVEIRAYESQSMSFIPKTRRVANAADKQSALENDFRCLPAGAKSESL